MSYPIENNPIRVVDGTAYLPEATSHYSGVPAEFPVADAGQYLPAARMALDGFVQQETEAAAAEDLVGRRAATTKAALVQRVITGLANLVASQEAEAGLDEALKQILDDEG